MYSRRKVGSAAGARPQARVAAVNPPGTVASMPQCAHTLTQSGCVDSLEALPESGLLWAFSADWGMLTMPVEKLREDLEAARLLLSARTFGDVREAELPSWARAVLDSEKDHLEGEGLVVDLSTPWVFTPDSYDAEMFPCPWDYNEIDWIDADVLDTNADIGGGPGYIDSLTVADPQAMLQALSSRGETLYHYQPLSHAYPLF